MTLQSPITESIEFDTQELFQAEPTQEGPIQIDEEQQHRAAVYSLLAALLRQSPAQELLDHLSSLPEQGAVEEDDLLLSMSMLGLSARMHTPESIDEEYHDLFIGLGKGEVVPYASWYLTGFLMEQPLSELRDDLEKLGFERNSEITEPEDHAAALFEVISLLITDANDLEVQNNFFQRHVNNWIESFFNDLSEAESSVFYKAVGRFGQAFIAFEKQYFSMQT